MTTKVYIDMSGGLKMPMVGIGTGGLRTEPELEKALNIALKLGYRHIDTAFVYQNEEFIARVLKKWFASGKLKREDIFVTTKLPVVGVHPDRVEMFMKKSLESLQLDYVDLYLIHFPIGMKYVEGQSVGSGSNYEADGFDHVAVWKKMEEQVDAGRTKTIGLSNFNQKQIERIIKSARIKPACLQVELRVDLQQRDLVKYCQENGVVVVAYSPLGAPGREGPRKVPLMLHNKTIKKIADKYRKTSAQIMLRYLLQKNIVVIPKSSNRTRLKENLDIFSFNIGAADMEALDDLEIGEDARFGRRGFFAGIEHHPEYPFPS